MGYNNRGRVERNHRLEIRLSTPEHERLNWACTHTDRPASQLVRAALATYIDNLASHEASAKPAFGSSLAQPPGGTD
ncbi:MAG: hypothetical protein CL581_03635 [Alteromonadaceae bacterium]|nr:hypothetical protein [Alteromonadaceae bacterium]|tara:strand:+ start:2908 stop:3138 length:231 start_codon:yes stop_codon:yes gene_type:complete